VARHTSFIEMLPRRTTVALAGLGIALTLLNPSVAGGAVPSGQTYEQVGVFVVDGDNDIAVNPSTGEVYVTDSNFDRIKRYSAAGALLGSVDVAEAGGIDVGPQGWLYVADYDGVTVLHPDLTLIGYFPEENVGVADVAVAPANGEVYVTDVVDDEVIRYSAGGTLLGRWGSSGSGNGQLDNPQSIAVGPGGDVYVGERWNNRVSHFDAAGNFLGAWGQLGTTNGAFHWPRGLSTDAEGNVYVADIADGAAQGGRVQVFTRTGGFLTAIGAFGAPPFSSFGPRDVDVSPSGQVRVITTDSSGTDVVATYAPTTTPPPPPPTPVPGAGSGKAELVKPKAAIELRGKRLRLKVRCAPGTPCTGTARVKVKGKAVTKPKAYSIDAGERTTITVRTTGKGRKVLRKKATTKAVLTLHRGRWRITIRR
jgi:DNA-binding beta-propeller fold protein YncE